jgi:hypothetical protein
MNERHRIGTTSGFGTTRRGRPLCLPGPCAVPDIYSDIKM